MTNEERLFAVHKARLTSLWGKKWAEEHALDKWPKDAKEWRQTPHGAPWDTNVDMAKCALALAKDLQKQGLLD